MNFTFSPIGIIHSCFKEKFGIPRQPGLVAEASATLELLPPYDREEALAGLEEFSHIWVTFVFHACQRDTWKATVRPPRLGGNQRKGVFATRSNFRPNPIGLSAVKLEKIGRQNGKLCLFLKGVDLLDSTPVLDIKPYLPYADTIPEASQGFAPRPQPDDIQVDFTPEALQACQAREQSDIPNLRAFLIEILRHDPRPGYYAQNPKKDTFGIKVFDLDVQWKIQPDRILITSLHREKTEPLPQKTVKGT